MGIGRFYHSKAGGLLIIFGVYFLFLGLPMIYELRLQLPGQAVLQETKGVAELVHVRKRGSFFLVTDEHGKRHKFTCRDLVSASHTCRFDLHKKEVDGAAVEVWWYEQKVYPFVTVNRVARMTMNGKEIVSLAETERRIRRLRAGPYPFDWWLSGGYFVVVLVGYAYHYHGKGGRGVG